MYTSYIGEFIKSGNYKGKYLMDYQKGFNVLILRVADQTACNENKGKQIFENISIIYHIILPEPHLVADTIFDV